MTDYAGELLRITVGVEDFTSTPMAADDVDNLFVAIYNSVGATVVDETAMTYSDEESLWYYLWDTTTGATPVPLPAGTYRVKCRLVDLAGESSWEYRRVRLSRNPVLTGGEATTGGTDGMITERWLADGAVTESKIADGAVTPDKLSFSVSTSDELDAEEAARIAADDGLQDAIDAEAASRAADLAAHAADTSVHGIANTGNLVLTDDSRLTDARSPTAHGATHVDDDLVPTATSSSPGLMAATDKTKLNGIEAGATADQSAAEILTAVKTVDGSGSGLDADMLDGLGSTFLRDRANHTGTQTLSTISDAGDAAALDVGSTTGTVAAGDDSRLTNARTPTAHATTHKSGGTDPVRLDELAAPTGGVALNAQRITGLADPLSAQDAATRAWVLANLLAGEPGADGLSVLSGAGAPDDADGQDGEWWIDTDDYDIYGPKAAGVWPTPGTSLIGPTGATGSTGATGTDGRTILSGTGAPSGGTGANGDFYLATNTSTLYGPKASGTWPSGVSLIGPAGTTGAAGDDGAPGVDGLSILNGSGVPTDDIGADGEFYIDVGSRIIDDFNRANGGIGDSPIGTPYEGNGAWTIASNKAVAPTLAGSQQAFDVGSPDVLVSVTISGYGGSGGTACGLCVRWSDNTHYVRFAISGSTAYLVKDYSTVWANWTVPAFNGVLSLRANGNVYTGYFDGAQIGTFTDVGNSYLAETKHGLSNDGTGGVNFDDLTILELASTGGAVLYGPKAGGAWPAVGLDLNANGLPAGGSTGQALVKVSDDDYDTDWTDLEDAAAAIATHDADTTSVHGIADTSTLVLTGDARLSNARTPTAHASSHVGAGSDPLAMPVTATVLTAYTLALAEANGLLTANNASAITITIPTNVAVAFPTGTAVLITQLGAGQVQIVGDVGVTVTATPGAYLRAQHSGALAVKRGTNTWTLFGDLAT